MITFALVVLALVILAALVLVIRLACESLFGWCLYGNAIDGLCKLLGEIIIAIVDANR